MQTRRVRIGASDIHLLGAIPGFVPHAQAVTTQLDAETPDIVALGIPPEDLEGLAALADAPDLELPEPEPASARLLELLQRFGETRIPSPELEAAHAWATAHDAGLEAIDLDDEEHAEVYIRHNRFFDVIKSNRLQKRLLAAAFDDAPDEDALAIAFDELQNSLPSLQKVEAVREAHMAARLRELAASGRVVAVVPLPRMAALAAALEDPEAT